MAAPEAHRAQSQSLHVSPLLIKMSRWPNPSQSLPPRLGSVRSSQASTPHFGRAS
jgi:hypothetical protein